MANKSFESLVNVQKQSAQDLASVAGMNAKDCSLKTEEADFSDLTYSHSLLSIVSGQKQKHYKKYILIGNVLRRLDRRRDGRWTHQFCVYVKSFNPQEDLSNFVLKVVFRFVENCYNRTIIVDEPPFQAYSYCSAEFAVELTVLFRDVNHTCTIFHYKPKVYAYDELGCELPVVVQELVRTITFVNPSTSMLKRLNMESYTMPDIDADPEKTYEGPDQDAIVALITEFLTNCEWQKKCRSHKHVRKNAKNVKIVQKQ